MPFSEYAKTMPEEEKKERFDGLEVKKGEYFYPKSGIDIKTLAERDEKGLKKLNA